ncbi:hypothetical protein Hanom_Chr17g01539351 [Helianthus anomalus]
MTFWENNLFLLILGHSSMGKDGPQVGVGFKKNPDTKPNLKYPKICIRNFGYPKIRVSENRIIRNFGFGCGFLKFSDNRSENY